MIVWLVKAGEPTPLDPGNPRLMRTGNLARHLAERGHTVVWWTAAFDHQRKVFRQPDTAAAARGFEIRLVNSLGYQTNVSFRRWADDIVLAWSLYRDMRRSGGRPDVIVCCYPLIFVSFAVVLFRLRHGGRLVLDVRDMWPDIFSAGRTGLKAFVYGMFGAVHGPFVRTVFRKADAITAITEPFLDWAMSLAGRGRSSLDAVFPLTSSPVQVSADERAAAREFFRGLGVTDETRNFCYIGSISNTVDLATVIAAGRQLAGRPIRLVLCGSGDQLAQLQQSARGLDTVVFPGFVDAARIRTLMEMSVAGLAPYRNRKDFLSSVPNKIMEYLSCGLPIVAGIEGLVGALVDTHGCGVKYREGDSAALAQALAGLADDPVKRARLSAAATALYNDRYSAAVVYGRFAEHVELAARATA